LNEAHRHREQAPCDHDAAHEQPHAPALRDHRAWNFEQKVAAEKDARAEAIRRRGEAEVRRHLQRGVAHVHAVEIRDDVEHDQIWHQPPHHASPRSRSDVWIVIGHLF
jgi:hypothetical protein